MEIKRKIPVTGSARTWRHPRRWLPDLKRRVWSFMSREALGLGLVGLVVAVWLLEPKVPMFAALAEPSTLVTFLSAIASTLGAIVGILIAVALVSYELLRVSFAGYATRELLRSAIFRHVLTLYVITIAVTVGAIAQIGKSVSPRAASLTWLVIFLSAACVAALIPVSKFILHSASPTRSRIAEMVKELDWRALGRLEYLHRYPVSTQLEVMESHPMFALRELALRSISEKDSITPRAIVSESGEQMLRYTKSISHEGDSDVIRTTYSSFLMLLRPVGVAALENRDESLLRTLMALYGQVHSTAASHKVSWSACIEFDEWAEDLLTAAAAAGLDSFLSSACWVISEVYTDHLKANVPLEADIWILHEFTAEKEPDHQKMLQWENVSTRYPRIIAHLAIAAINNGHTGPVSSALLTFGNMISAVEGLEPLGMAQKRSAIRGLYYHIQQLLITSATKVGNVPTLGFFGIGYLSIMRALENDFPWAQMGLLTSCETVLRLGRMQKIDARTLNELGSIGRGCIDKIAHAPRFAEAVFLIVRTFSQVVDEYIKIMPSPAAAPDIFAALDEQVESFERWFASRGITHEVIQSEIQRVRSRVRESGALSHPSLTELAWPNLS